MERALNIAKLILPLISSILAYKLVRISFKENKVKKFSKMTSGIMEVGLKKSNTGYFSYKRIESYLQKMGVNDMFEGKVTPSSFMLVKIFMGLILALIGIKEQILLLTIGLALLGFFLPDIFINLSNNEDNDKILVDLKRVYDTLRIQTKAGVFLTSSIAECYLVAENKRLKKALLELNNKIIAKNDIESAIEDFNSKFKNPYIDTFCIVIKQSLESGKTVQILEDLSAQIKDIQQAISIREAERVKYKLEGLQFLVYVGVIAIVAYGIFTELITSLMNF
ncbi:hypothetical protein [uncultured Clostridium sp.]|jgi:pilus assembly protein TadC|uniref:hypothetical protein n=1 Tax=uncultured Clostridium sp. TaxID=59620 RepID=UPI00267398EE|nr:hypothetical protein [uncultured Clostridium sp.]